MAVGDIISQTYGTGGYDPAKPNGNVVEQSVVVAETATSQAIEVRDAAGAVIRTETRQRDLTAENGVTLRAQAANALANNRTYVALASPTNAQVAAQVKALTRQSNGVIRLLLNQLDGTD